MSRSRNNYFWKCHPCNSHKDSCFDSLYIIEPNSGCWLWFGKQINESYGRFHDEQAHVVSYKRNKGIVPEGYDVHHKCETPPCVNPDHLKIIKHGSHTIYHPRGGGSKEFCKHGHRYTDEDYTPFGVRKCRECHRIRERERYYGSKKV